MDRASGSGVFSRDPDALLDLIELDVTKGIREQHVNNTVCTTLAGVLGGFWMMERLSQDDLCSAAVMRAKCREYLNNEQFQIAMQAATAAEKACETVTAWRIEGTLREFPKFAPINLWFEYPAHKVDRTGVLVDAVTEAEAVQWKQKYASNFSKQKGPEERKQERVEGIEAAFEVCSMGETKVAIEDLVTHMGVSEKTVRRRLKESGKFWVDDGECGLK